MQSEPLKSPPPNDSWFSPVWFCGLLGVFILAAFSDVVSGTGGFFLRDYGIFTYPLAHYARESFWRGEIPLWNPLNDCGIPFLAQWNTMVLYPLSLFYWLLPLSLSLGWFCLGHLFIGGLGMYYLARRWTGNSLAAGVAGMGYAWNGLMLTCLAWTSYVAALAWVPWLVLTAEQGWREGGRPLLAAVTVGTLQMLSGAPEIIVFTWLFIGVVWLARGLPCHSASKGPPSGMGGASASGHRTNRDRPRQLSLADTTRNWVSVLPRPWRGIHWRRVGRFALLIGWIAALAAAQLLPFIELLKHSGRAVHLETDLWSMPVWGFANFLVPLYGSHPSHQGVYAQLGQNWASSYYLGIGLLWLAALAVARIRERRVWLLGGTALLGVLLAMGKAGHVFSWVSVVLPLDYMRYPIKFVFLTMFAVPLLAASSIARFRELDRDQWREERRSLVSWTVLFALACGGIAWVDWKSPLPFDDWKTTLASSLSRTFLLFWVVVMISLLPRVRKARALRFWGVVFLVLLWLDVMTCAPRLNPTVPRWVFREGLAAKELQFRPLPALGRSRAMVSPAALSDLYHLNLTNPVQDYLYSRLGLVADCNLLDDIPKVDGFFGLYPGGCDAIQKLLYATPSKDYPRLERFLGVSQRTANGRMIQWTARTNFLGLVTAGQQPVFLPRTNLLAALLAPGFAPDKDVLLPRAAEGLAGARADPKARITGLQVGHQRLVFSIETRQPALAVIAQTDYPGWKAYVDRRPAPIWPANFAFQAVKVPAGRHEVQLIYQDDWFYWGCWISGIAFLALVISWFCEVSSSRRILRSRRLDVPNCQPTADPS